MKPHLSPAFWIFLSIIISGYHLWDAHVHAQTKVSPDQTRPSALVVEWASCEGDTGPKTNCTGLEYLRLRLADGTIKGPYLASPVSDPTLIKSPPFTWKPLN